MPVPRRRHSKCRRDKARTHKKLHAHQVATCDDCGAPKLPHRVCPSCGKYRGRTYKTVVTTS
jgi:large subunit ribosomal protein L32